MPRKKRGSGWENDRSKAGDKNAHKSKKSKKSCSHCGQAIVVPSVALAKAKKAVAVAASSNGKAHRLSRSWSGLSTRRRLQLWNES